MARPGAAAVSSSRPAHAETPEHRNPPEARSGSPACGPARDSRATAACVPRRPYIAQPYRHSCRRGRPVEDLDPQGTFLQKVGLCPPGSFRRCTAAAPGSACCCRNADSPEPPAVPAGSLRDPASSAGATRPGLRLLRLILFQSPNPTRPSATRKRRLTQAEDPPITATF